MNHEIICASAIFAAIIVAVYRVNQHANRQWHLHGGIMRRKGPDGAWEKRAATSKDRDKDWLEQQW